MQRSLQTTTAALVALAALMLAGCGLGSGGPEVRISETTDNYLRALASGDTAKACAQLTSQARASIGKRCWPAMKRIAARIGHDRLDEIADEGSSISVDGSTGSATLKGLDSIRLDMAAVGSRWLIAGGYALDDGS